MGNRQGGTWREDIDVGSERVYPQKNLEDEPFLNQVYNNTGSFPNKIEANVSSLLHKREIGGKMRTRARANIGQRYLPTNNANRTLMRYSNRIFCAQFSTDGDIFMSATQDRRIRFYNRRTWTKTKEVVAGDVGWAIIDTDFSPDQRWLIYSGWSDYVNLCNVVGDHEVHDHLKINSNPYQFCLFSIKFSPDSNEIVGGSNDNCLYIYDLNRRELLFRLEAHENDINTVAYAEKNNNNIILSGSDDCLCKVWDRRLMGSQQECVGAMIGHSQGITHINPKGDGRYFISNGKDQCIKLWDIRKMSSTEDAKKYVRHSYDYRYGSIQPDESVEDHSLMTYRGHLVAKTLIRSYFSPEFSTGQRYIYTGSSDGVAYVYDILTGKTVAKLSGHVGLVRDLSWHPTEPLLATTSWDGQIATWNYSESKLEKRRVPVQAAPEEPDEEQDE